MLRGWIGFGAWGAVGALAAVAIAGAASVGLFLLPAAAVALVVGAARIRTWPEGLGALEGAALTLIALGIVHLGDELCANGGTLVLAPGQHEAACGGLDPAPLLIAGLLVGVIAAGMYALIRRAVPR